MLNIGFKGTFIVAYIFGGLSSLSASSCCILNYMEADNINRMTR